MISSATHENIELFRNETRTFSCQYVDENGVPLSLAGKTLTSSAKAFAGDVAVIANATIIVTNAAQGLFTYSWNGADFAAYGSLSNEVNVAWDLKLDNDVVGYGQIILKPGVTA